MRCPGCAAKTPLLTQGQLLELLDPGARMRGASACLIIPDRFHVRKDALAALRKGRQGAGSSEAPASPVPPSGRPRKPGEPLERDVKRGVKSELEGRGWLVLDFEQDYRPTQCRQCGAELGRGSGTRVPLGTPDLYIAGHGLAFWIEVKRPGGAVSKHQHELHAKLRAAGDRVYIIRSSRSAVELEYRLRQGEKILSGEYPPPPKE